MHNDNIVVLLLLLLLLVLLLILLFRVVTVHGGGIVKIQFPVRELSRIGHDANALVLGLERNERHVLSFLQRLVERRLIVVVLLRGNFILPRLQNVVRQCVGRQVQETGAKFARSIMPKNAFHGSVIVVRCFFVCQKEFQTPRGGL